MPPPVELPAGPVVLTRWRKEWASESAHAVRASLTELQPFMAWATDDYDIEGAQDFLDRCERDWAEGREFNYAVRLPADSDNGELVGSAGLMRDMGPGVLEIGYWIHSAHTGKGYATAVAGGLAKVGLSIDGIDRVAIRHDAANRASGRVAEKAGFTEITRRPSTLEATPGASGIEVVWELRGGTS